MLLNNKLVKKYKYLDCEPELNFQQLGEFSFNYDESCDLSNKKEINRFVELISKQKGDMEHFGLILSLENNPFVQFISICDCGHVHKFSFNINCDDYKYNKRDTMKKQKDIISICPNCKKPFTEDLSDYELPINEDITVSSFLFSGVSEETNTLHIDICEYSFYTDSNKFSISINTKECYRLKRDEYDGDYEPFNKYSSYLNIGEWFDYNEDTTHLGAFHKDLYETVYEFNPEFKKFLSINEGINKCSSDKFIGDNAVESNSNIHLFFKYYNIFCDLYKYYSKYSESLRKCITKILINFDDVGKSFQEVVDSVKSLDGNEYVLNKFFEKIPIDTLAYIDSISDITCNIPFFKEIIDSNLDEYVNRYIEEGMCSLKDLSAMNSLKRQFDDVDIETFIKYIIRGAVNDGLNVSTVINELSEMKNGGYNIEFKGAYKARNYKKFEFLDKFEENDKLLFISLESKNTFDGIYKELVNYSHL